MNLSKLLKITFVGVCAACFICGEVKGQISGTGTTGSTAGSGTGGGSAGVMTGTGPDPRGILTPYEQTLTTSASETVLTKSNIQHKKRPKARSASKKIRSKTSTMQNTPEATPTAAPSPR